ncbi:MAG: hypothetical protein IJA94_06345 [Bacilli bacterium]|nr:hypothetical protein [Bacilli bacterium]
MLAKREIPSNVINYEMCKSCTSPCCGHTPCEYLPSDFDDLTIDNVEQLIINNLAIIDEGYLSSDKSKMFYYLRMRTNRENLNSMDISNKNDIYLSKEGRKGACLYYKASEKYYYGIEYAKYDGKMLLSLSELELLKLFRSKLEREKTIKSVKVCIEEYLAARKERAWGGCLLTEDQRPGGGLFIVPDLKSDGTQSCKILEQYSYNGWDMPENQEVLKRILDKNGILKK